MTSLQALKSVCDTNIGPPGFYSRCAAELNKEIQQTVLESISQAPEVSFFISEGTRKKRGMLYYLLVAFLHLAHSQIQAWRVAKFCIIIYCCLL